MDGPHEDLALRKAQWRFEKLLSLCEVEFARRFRCMWKATHQTAWGTRRTTFKSIYRSIYENLTAAQKRVVDTQSGCMDISLSCRLLTGVRWPRSCMRSKPPNRCIDRVRQWRNKLAHESPSLIWFLTNEDSVRQALADDLQVPEHAIQSALEGISKVVHEEEVIATVTASPKDQAECLRLKDEGNGLYVAKRYDQAVHKYTAAIGLCVADDHLQGILFCSRAAARMEYARTLEGDRRSSMLKQAALDAAQTTDLRPKWAKGYARLGRIEYARHNMDNACVAFERALALDPPDSNNIKQLLWDVRDKLGSIHREEHRDTAYHYPTIFEQSLQGLEESFCSSMDNMDVEVSAALLASRDPAVKGAAYCARGNRARARGLGTEAVQQFVAAARISSAEGMYNYALCLLKGFGCERDVAEAIEWLERATRCSTTITMLGREQLNVGVGAALHALGLLHSDGIGVPKSDERAYGYWERAAQLGIPNAQNNLGMLLQTGSTAIRMDQKRAVELFRTAAEAGDSHAMFNLGGLCMQGFGVPVSFERALALFEWAEQRGLTAPKVRKLAHVCRRVLEAPDTGTRHQAGFAQYLQFLSSKRHNITPAIPLDERVHYSRAFLEANGSSYARKLLAILDCWQEAEKQWLDSNIVELSLRCCEALRDSDAFMLLRHFPRPALSFLTTVWNASQQKALDQSALQLHASEDFRANRELLEVFAARLAAQTEPGLTSNAERLEHALMCVRQWGDSMILEQHLGQMYMFAYRFDDSVRWLKRAIRHGADGAYDLAVALRLNSNQDESSQWYEEFLSTCEEGHRKIPEAYWCIAINTYTSAARRGDHVDFGHLRSLYDKGLAATRTCVAGAHTANHSTSRKILEQFLGIQQNLKECNSDWSRPNAVQQALFVSRHHRSLARTAAMSPTGYVSQHGPRASSGLSRGGQATRAVTIEEMACRGEYRIYQDCILTCMIMAPWERMASIMTVVMDRPGSFVRLALYSASQRECVRFEQHGVGTVLSITNPYYRRAVDGIAIVRIDDCETVSVEGIKSVCWKCGVVTDTLQSCGRCRTAKYCSRACQRTHWREMDHRAVCKPHDKG